jgi:uncharacterized protein (DUF302 family)
MLIRPMLFALTTILLASVSAQAELKSLEAKRSVGETIDTLQQVVVNKGFKVFARVDHAAGAKSVNQELRPTELLIFGNPAGGTPLIQAEQTMGLTLPLKMLVWQDDKGKVWIGYDDMAELGAARGLAADHPAIAKVNAALEALAIAAAK